MNNEKVLELDGVEYRFHMLDASTAWGLLTNALSTINTQDLAQVSVGNEETSLALVGAVLNKINTPQLKSIQEKIWRNIVVNKNGNTYRISDNFDQHFNEYRGHLIKLLWEGLRFQFSPFFAGGLQSLIDTKA